MPQREGQSDARLQGRPPRRLLWHLLLCFPRDNLTLRGAEFDFMLGQFYNLNQGGYTSRAISAGVLHCNISSNNKLPRLRNVERILQNRAACFSVEKLD